MVSENVQNVHFLASHPTVFALGAIALHATHGVVDIIGRDADRRLVRWYEHEPLPLPEDDPECLFNEAIAEMEAWVPVSDLQRVTPRHDVDREMLKAYYDDRRACQCEAAHHDALSVRIGAEGAPTPSARCLTLVSS